MRHLFISLFFVCFFLTASTQDIIPGQVLVQTTGEVQITDILEKTNEAFNYSSQIRLKKALNENLNIYLVSHLETVSEQEVVNKLYQMSGILHAQMNHVVQLRETTPLDPQYGSQWHHENIDSELAWDISTGGLTVTGDEIVVCVIEGGNLGHADLQGNAWINTQEIPDNGIDDDNNGYIDDVDGWNVASEDDEGVFQGGHGTQVMGMIGAKGDNDLGVVGANWDVKIMSVAGENANNEASLVEAYGYPLDMRNLYESSGGSQGAFVVATNASWGINGGDPADSPIWCGLYQTLGEAGILNCGATSNSNVNIDVVGDLPTACASDYMISVTATNINDVRTFSGFGQTTIDLGAPGDQVFTTSGTDTYGATTGTSFASPLTAGVIGLLYSVPCPSLMELVHSNPQAGADLIRQALFDGVDPIDNLTTECVTGGRVNSFNSLNILLETCSTDACFAPFNSTQITDDNVSFEIEWAAFNAEDTYGFRYKLISDIEWIETLDLPTPYINLGELEWCSEYEYQLRSFCPEDTESDWNASNFIQTDGCCVSPSPETLTLDFMSETQVEVNWPSSLAAVAYNMVYSEIGGSAITIENITDSTYSLTDLEPCTEYEVSIISVCAGATPSDNNSLVFTSPGCGACNDISYCVPEIADIEDEFISGVQIGDFENTSGNDGGYVELLDEEIIINRNTSYDLIVSLGFGGNTFQESVAVWIDYNQDGNFTSDELLASEPNTQTGLDDQFTVPTTALLGLTRMRVSVVWSGDVQNIQDPCQDYEFGDTEDYCVTIDEFDSVEEVSKQSVTLFPNPANNELIVTLNETPANSKYYILDLAGRTVLTGKMSSDKQTITIESLTSGTYLLGFINQDGLMTQTKFVKM